MLALPEWTEKADKRGLDPLGMQNSGVALYQSLMPGISNVTLRMRYYGYYCWVSDTYAQYEGSTDFELWRQWIRRAEALYALVSASRGDEGGVGGIEWANERLNLGESVIDFAEAASTDPDVTRYLRQPLGVFGGAYFSQMSEMGLYRTGDHGIPKATREAGVKLAAAFRASLDPDTEELLVSKIQTARVTPDELETLSVIAPSVIPDEGDEREVYERVLLAHTDDSSESDRSRRLTLSLMLRVADEISAFPDPETFRWAMFEWDGPSLPEELEQQRLRWEAYQAQDLFQVAAAALLAWAISILAETDEGLMRPELKAQIRGRLIEALGARAHSAWTTFRSTTAGRDDQYQDDWIELTGSRALPQAKARTALGLMATLQDRVLNREDLAAEIQRGFPNQGPARSVLTELAWLNANEHRPFVDVVTEYVLERVVDRHSWVAMQKFRRQRDYTFLFEVRDGRLARRSTYDPVATNPRLAPAIQFLWDIGLIDDAGLTARGRAALGQNR